MNKVKAAFFGLGEGRDPQGHREFNWWHDTDHMPENLAAPGTLSARRWVAPPAYREARTGQDGAVDSQYLFCYLLADPVERSIADFATVGRQTRDLGRFYRAMKIHTAGHFDLLGALKPDRTVLSVEALPYAPWKGVFLSMADLRVPEARQAVMDWHQRVHLPDLLTVRGVAGVYSFWSRPGLIGGGRHVNPPNRFVHLCFLDEDPLAMVEDLTAQTARWAAAGRLMDTEGLISTVLRGPFLPITPGRYEWFG